MAWCERNRVGYIFGLAGNKVLLRRVTVAAEQVGLDRLDAPAQSKARRYAEFPYAAKTWNTERRVIARVEASGQGVDSRFIVTNLAGLAKSLYEKIYCARGQAENLIKAHKLHLASDRTSCTKATANQFRLVMHTAAYWLMHTLRALAPKTSFWRDAQFDTPAPQPDQGRRPGHRTGHQDQDLAADRLCLSARLRNPRRWSGQTAAVIAGARSPAKTLVPSTLKPRKNAPPAPPLRTPYARVGQPRATPPRCRR